MALVGVVLIGLAGCATGPVEPTYTQEELAALCIRHGGHWHPDGMFGGFCEYNSQM
jgi:hypothetical protein